MSNPENTVEVEEVVEEKEADASEAPTEEVKTEGEAE